MSSPTTAFAARKVAKAAAEFTLMAAIALAALSARAAVPDPAAAPDIPVPVGTQAAMDACPGLGSVARIRTFLAVRAGPGVSYRQTDALNNGHMLFLCSASADGQWQGVVYAADPGLQECGVSSPVATAGPYRGPCKSGWVRATWVAVLAG